jgi:hypothetical protein
MSGHALRLERRRELTPWGARRLITQLGGRPVPSDGSSCAHEPTRDAAPWATTAAGADITTTNRSETSIHADTWRRVVATRIATMMISQQRAQGVSPVGRQRYKRVSDHRYLIATDVRARVGCCRTRHARGAAPGAGHVLPSVASLATKAPSPCPPMKRASIVLESARKVSLRSASLGWCFRITAR